MTSTGIYSNTSAARPDHRDYVDDSVLNFPKLESTLSNMDSDKFANLLDNLSSTEREVFLNAVLSSSMTIEKLKCLLKYHLMRGILEDIKVRNKNSSGPKLLCNKAFEDMVNNLHPKK